MIESSLAYTGPEQRRAQRRVRADRRTIVRFELDKPPRRSGNERRRNAGTTDIWTRGKHF